METHLRPGDNSREPRPTRVDRRTFSATATQNLSLRDRFELDRPCSSHGDNRRKVRNHVGSPPPVVSGYYSKQQTRRVNAADNDELVKHMSHLPSYLERGAKPQEKAFNVGVLDWNLLEKWQSSKQVPYRSDGSSSSNSISSSLFSTEESSTHSQTGHSYSAAHHRHRHPVYQFHLKGFPSEACTADGKSSRNVGKNQLGSTAESIVKEGLGSNASSKKTAYPGSNDLSSSSKVQCHRDLEKEPRRSRRSQSMSLDKKFTEKDVLVRPLDDCSIISLSKVLKGGTGRKIPEEKEISYTERSRKAQFSEHSCDIPRSCPLPRDVNDQKIRVLSRSQETKTNDSTSAGKLISPFKDGSSKDNHQALLTTALPPVTDFVQGSRISKRTVDAANPRYPSPTGELSFRIGASSRKLSSTDAEVLQACSAHAKPCTNREVPFVSLEKTSSDKSAATSKARSSPLKRLLEPLLKPREGTNRRSSLPLKKDSNPVGRASKTQDRPSTAPGIRVGLNLNSEKSASVLKSHQNGKNSESEVIQALLQVVVQNGCPLFTFAVDNVKDILCAALSKLTTEKATLGDGYLYTFFSIQELKNKSWKNLRGKGNGHEYSPNVVAQMEVSATPFSNMEDHTSTDKNFLRQFVLSAVDLKPGEKTESGYQQNDELAAVVVSIPGETDNKVQTGKNNGITVILPSGIHTLPSKGKPSSLVQRWRSGGQCDCGGWDSGCKLTVLSDSKFQSSSSIKFKLYDQGGVEGKQPVFNLAPFKDKEGVLSVSFSTSISPLQAFSICLAVLDAKKHSRTPTPAKVQEAKSFRGEVPGGYFSVPPHSPVGRV